MSKWSWQKWGRLLILAMGLGLGFELSMPGTASAACGAGDPATPYNTIRWCGYFDRNKVTTGDGLMSYFTGSPRRLVEGIDPSVVSAHTLIDYINERRLGLWGDRNEAGASFVILTMLGVNSPVSINEADNRMNEWANLVRAYERAGRIEWHYAHPFPCGVLNTYHQDGTRDVAFYNEPASAGRCGPSVTRDSIVFRDGSGRIIYSIKRDCANPIGEVAGLPALDYDVDLSVDRNGSPETVTAGRTGRLGVSLLNNGPAPSANGVIQVMLPARVDSPCPTCASGQTPLVPAVGGAYGYRGASSIPGVSGANWYWDVNSLGDDAGTGGSMEFTVSASTPGNTIITFDVYYYPSNSAGAVEHRTITYRVISERTPAVVGRNSDIHAGGGVCGGTLSSGSIKGYPGSVSGGQYVVSASALINDFVSNNAGADALRMGANGAYAQICRPDLVKAATAYVTAGTGYQTIGAGSRSVTGMSGVYVIPSTVAGDLHLTGGTVGHRITIVHLGTGNVYIDGNIQIDNARYNINPNDPDNSIPSLGVIARNDIMISRAATRVDAYLFANGAIDTCYQADSTCSTPTLVVRGFFMAKDLLLHRLGPLNSNGNQIGEEVILNPQIYINPPRLFDASVDDVLLEGQGEKQPLF